MKTYLIKASAPGPFKDYKKAMGAPPQNIFSVAAATPDKVDVVLCDETIGMKPDLKTDADVVALFFHTPDAVHAYALADKYRSLGKTVVLGGLHASFMPDEAGQHADAVLIGEAEGVWEDLLEDVEANRLQPKYKRTEPVDPSTLKPYPTDLIPPSKYNYLWSVVVSRGCPHQCDFCTVPQFFEGKYRWRPVEQVVAEIKAVPKGCWFELHADNLTANRKYALELFKALTPLGIKWVGEATIKLADDQELLRAAAESGCKSLMVGVETSSGAALKDSGKDFVAPETVREKIRRFHAHGIEVSSSMIFGFDSHTTDIFRESAEFCRFVELDEVESVILIPFPGTPLHQRIKNEGRLISEDWSKFDGSQAVYKPSLMTPEELEEGAEWFWKEIRKRKPAPAEIDPVDGTKKRNSGPRLVGDTGAGWRWKSILALMGIGAGLVFDLYWIWGLLFLVWALTDIRNGFTYLLEDIPRKESPILYWIVVSMWLFLGIWTLGFSPGSPGEKWLAQTTPEHSWYEIVPEVDPRSPVEQPEIVFAAGSEGSKENPDTENPLPRVFRNEHFGYTVRIPETWLASEEVESGYVSLNLDDGHETGSVTVLAMDLGRGYSIDRFIAEMEKDLEKTMPQVISHGQTQGDLSTELKNEGLTLQLREYSGEYGGYPVVTQVAYGVNEQSGYCVIGIYGKGDHKKQKVVQQIMGSLVLP